MAGGTTPPLPTGEKLDQAEWDFRSVPDIQLEGCAYYEYARASKTLTEKLAELHEQQRHGEEVDIIDEIYDLFANRPRMSLACSEFMNFLDLFPAVPWQKIKKKRREEIVEDKLSGFDPMTFDGSVPGRFLVPPHRIVARIYWDKSDAVILDDFKKWLKKHRPLDSKPKSTRGQSAEHIRYWRNGLLFLGVYRLVKRLGIPEAKRLTTATLGDSLYLTDESWNKTAAKAEVFFSKHFPRHVMSDS
jgi:hypothetical protein